MKKLVPAKELENQFEFAVPEILSTDIPTLDWALNGGIPAGRQTSLNGAEGGGKSSTALWLGSRFLKVHPGKNIFLEEGEGKPHQDYHVIKALGYTSINSIVRRRPKNIGELLTEVDKICHEQEEAFIIIDSLSSFGENRGEYGTKDFKTINENAAIGNEAAKYAMWMKGPALKLISTKKIYLILINQIRDNQNSRFGGTHTPGGHAPKHLDSVTIKVAKNSDWKIQDSENNIIGQNITYTIEKNMIGAPYREAVVPFYYSYGFDPEESLLIEAYKFGVIKMTSGWFEWGVGDDGKTKRYRKADFVNLMRTDLAVRNEILEKVLIKLG
jgi:RecA/RadA recombinase